MSEPKQAGHHEYDGIIELDHPIPRWFNVLFWTSILGASLYGVIYSLGPAEPLQREWEADRQAWALAVYQSGAGTVKTAEASESDLVALVAQKPRRESGGKVYAGKCAACHGAQGQGGIGPNLTDDAWLHGGRLVDIARTIRVGVGEKGMPPWESVLSAEEIQDLTAFIASLSGTNPPGAKAPQGVPKAM